ncbi:MAG: KH domain-containing protein [Verrucomicrobiota bacterium]|nr:KH domain-containing protein [Verrucomicrobiota bacterium]
MLAFLEQVVKGLVDYPDAVNITEVEQERTTVYELRLDPSDVGRVIGRSGRTVNAIRTLLQAGSAKAGKFTRLDIIDEKEDSADE